MRFNNHLPAGKPRPDSISPGTHSLCFLPQSLPLLQKLSLTRNRPSLDPVVCSLGQSSIFVIIPICQVLLWKQISDQYLRVSVWHTKGDGSPF